MKRHKTYDVTNVVVEKERTRRRQILGFEKHSSQKMEEQRNAGPCMNERSNETEARRDMTVWRENFENGWGKDGLGWRLDAMREANADMKRAAGAA